MDEVRKESQLRKVELLSLPTIDAIAILNRGGKNTNAICTLPAELQLIGLSSAQGSQPRLGSAGLDPPSVNRRRSARERRRDGEAVNQADAYTVGLVPLGAVAILTTVTMPQARRL
jgi:hypothetical protein